MIARTATWAALMLVATATHAAAQQWSFDAQVGRVRAALDPTAEPSETFVLGVRHDRTDAGLRVSAGVPLGARDYVWGSLAGWERLALRRRGFVAGMDLTGSAFLLHDLTDRDTQQGLLPTQPPAPQPARQSGYAVAGQTLPVLGYESSAFQLHVRAGVSRYNSDLNEQRLNRTVQLADAQLTYLAAPGVVLLPAVRWFRGEGERAVSYAGLTAMLARERAAVWASAGQWMNFEADERTAWAAGASLKLHPRTSLVTSVRRDVFDPLYLSPPQTSWNAGLSVQFAGRVGPPPAPVPAAYSGGVATVKLPASAARSTPSIAGDFNGWKPEPMRRSGRDWIYTATIAPGVYNYAFVDESGEWFVPEGVPGRRDDGMGGHVAVLVVR